VLIKEGAVVPNFSIGLFQSRIQMRGGSMKRLSGSITYNGSVMKKRKLVCSMMQRFCDFGSRHQMNLDFGISKINNL